MKKYTARFNTYFKGGQEDNFISGQWIGDKVQDSVIFVLCHFNSVDAEFRNCIFIDCISPPDGENCTVIRLVDEQRIVVQHLIDGNWLGNL